MLHGGAFHLNQNAGDDVFVTAAVVDDEGDECGLRGSQAGIVGGGFGVRAFVDISVSVDNRYAGGTTAVRRV